MKLRPLGDKIVILPDEPVKSVGGVVLATSSIDKPERARVIGVGRNVIEVAEGDAILFSKYGANEVQGEDYLILREDDVLAVIE